MESPSIAEEKDTTMDFVALRHVEDVSILGDVKKLELDTDDKDFLHLLGNFKTSQQRAWRPANAIYRLALALSEKSAYLSLGLLQSRATDETVRKNAEDLIRIFQDSIDGWDNPEHKNMVLVAWAKVLLSLEQLKDEASRQAYDNFDPAAITDQQKYQKGKELIRYADLNDEFPHFTIDLYIKDRWKREEMELEAMKRLLANPFPIDLQGYRMMTTANAAC